MQNGQNTPDGVLLYSKWCVLFVDVWFYAMRRSALKWGSPIFYAELMYLHLEHCFDDTSQTLRNLQNYDFHNKNSFLPFEQAQIPKNQQKNHFYNRNYGYRKKCACNYSKSK